MIICIGAWPGQRIGAAVTPALVHQPRQAGAGAQFRREVAPLVDAAQALVQKDQGGTSGGVGGKQVFGAQAVAGGPKIETVAVDEHGHGVVQAIRCSWNIASRMSNRCWGSAISSSAWRILGGSGSNSDSRLPIQAAFSQSGARNGA